MRSSEDSTTAVELNTFAAVKQEDIPFLDASDTDRESLEQLRAADTSPISSKPSYTASRWQVRKPSSIVLLAATAKFFVVASGLMLMMPMYRLIEDAMCHVHFEDDSIDIIDEMKCKGDEVQSSLAYMMGWFGLINSVVTFAVAYPYGILSDTIGRKPVLLMAYTGQALVFLLVPVFFGTLRMFVREHPYILLINVFFTLMGGGIPVLMSTFYAIASDVSTEKTKTSYFLYMALGAAGGGLLGPLTAGILMSKYGPWVPIYVTLFSIPFLFGIILLIPETLVNKAKSSLGRPMTVREHISSGVKDLSSAIRILRNRNVSLVLVVFFFSNPRMTAETTTLTQYISKYFGWTLAQMSVLLSPLGLVGMLVLALLPKLSDLLTSSGRYGLGWTTFRKDLFLLRASTLLIAVASMLLGFSGHIVPFLIALFVATLGSAESPLGRATVSHFVDDAYTSRLYALIGMTEVLGSFTGGPVLAWFFEKGMKIKGVFTGLPFFYVSILCFLTLGALMFVKPPHTTGGDTETLFSDDESVGEPHPDAALRLA